MIKRYLEKTLIEKISNSNKIVILYGARQVGKSTLCGHVIKKLSLKTLTINTELISDELELIKSRDLEKLRFLEDYQLLFIDEAQRVAEIGLILKVIHDHFPSLRILVTGSSSLDLAGKINEPLTGRHWSYILYPISLGELGQDMTKLDLIKEKDKFLTYGLYPDVLNEKNFDQKKMIISKLSGSYLFKDILEFESIKHADKLHKLLELLAFQIGSEVSVLELSQNLGISRTAIERYIDLLEKSFVIKRLGGFSKNLRKEIRKQDKIYFYDLGVRNAVLRNFNLLEKRTDVGAMWENFIVMELFKKREYQLVDSKFYYYRTHTGLEIDLVESKDGSLSSYEIKYGKKKVRLPKSFLETYKGSTFEIINQDNYLELLIK